MAIPKRINFIWMQGWSEFPSRLQENVDSVIKQNPGWEIIKWDEDSLRKLITDLGPEYLKKWESFKILHQKIDYGRYALLYGGGGGVSVDTDIFALKGFDSTPHINDSDFIVSWNSRGDAINNATILVSEKNYIMKNLLDSITTDCSPIQSNFSCVHSTTGPNAFTKFLDDYKDQITVLDHKYFEPCSSSDAWCEIPQSSITDHRHELSWLNPFQRSMAKIPHFIRHYRIQIIIAIILIILLIIILRK